MGDACDLATSGVTVAAPCGWSAPTFHDLRDYHRDVMDILATADRDTGRPPTNTHRVDAVLLHPAFGLAFLFRCSSLSSFWKI
jgi:ferrous iron transport protein B